MFYNLVMDKHFNISGFGLTKNDKTISYFYGSIALQEMNIYKT
jgi:hypothetical protein